MHLGKLFVSLPVIAALCLSQPLVKHLGTLKSGSDIMSMENITPAMMRSPPGAPLLSDIIGQKQCTIMSDYAMGLEALARRLADSSQKTLVLAPINSAITALPRKPWVDGPDGSQDPKISPFRNEDKAAKNIEAFVSRHIIEQYPLTENSVVRSLAGQNIKYEVKNGEKYINGDNKVVLEKEAENGAIWILSRVIPADTNVGEHEGL